jgi:hypothetical protein
VAEPVGLGVGPSFGRRGDSRLPSHEGLSRCLRQRYGRKGPPGTSSDKLIALIFYTCLPLLKSIQFKRYVLTRKTQIKDKLKEFQDLKSRSPDFEPLLKSLMSDLSQHIKEEEESDLPALEKAISTSDCESRAKSFNRTKMCVPSRSHPMAPQRPPFETLVGLLTARLDRLGDLLRKYPDNQTGAPNPPSADPAKKQEI